MFDEGLKSEMDRNCNRVTVELCTDSPLDGVSPWGLLFRLLLHLGDILVHPRGVVNIL